MGRAGVSRTNIPFFLPPYTLVSLFFISFFFSFSFFLRHPCRRCRFPSSPDLEQIRGDSIRRISTSRPVPLRVNNSILLQKFLFFFFPTVLKISRRRRRGCPLRNTVLPSCCFHIQKSHGYLDRRFSIEPDHHYHHYPPPNPGSKMDASTSSSEKHDPKYSKFGAIC